MTRENPWTQHYQAFWQEIAGRAGLPLWLRVAAVAYGGHRRNGHTPLRAGDLQLALSLVDPASGELVEPTKSSVSRALKVAVDFGFIAKGSHAGCLVVPRHAIRGGMLGDERERCNRH